MFDAATGKTRHILTGHGAPVSMVAYSNDGRLLASVGFDAKLRIFDAATGSPLAEREAPGRLITVAFGDALIATGTFGGEIDLWSIDRFDRLRSFRCSNERIAHEVVIDGDQVHAICGPTLETFRFNGTSQVHDLGSEFACLAISGDRVLHTGTLRRPTRACAFCPDGSFYVTIEEDGAVRSYDREGRPRWTGPRGETRLDLGMINATGDEDGTATIRDAEGTLLSMRLFGPSREMRRRWYSRASWALGATSTSRL